MSINIIKKVAGLIVLLAVVGSLCYCGFRVVSALIEKTTLPGPKTIEEISKIDFGNIDHIETTRGSLDPAEFNHLFRANLYETFSGDIDFRRSETYRCYDSENKLLMTLKNYSQSSVIELNVNGIISLYQKYTPPAETTSSNLLVK